MVTVTPTSNAGSPVCFLAFEHLCHGDIQLSLVVVLLEPCMSEGLSDNPHLHSSLAGVKVQDVHFSFNTVWPSCTCHYSRHLSVCFLLLHGDLLILAGSLQNYFLVFGVHRLFLFFFKKNLFF